MTVRAVFFDLGDTIWHFPKMPPFEIVRGETERRIAALLRSWGIEVSGPTVDYYLGRDVRFALERADRAAYNGDLVSPDVPSIVQSVAKAKGFEFTREQGAALWDTWNLGGEFLGRTVFSDAIPTLELLREQGYRLAAVTNRYQGGAPFREELARYGLLDLFEALSVSCEVGYMKPHPKIFEHTMTELAVRPDECVMVGDNLRADVQGAQALGITTVWRRPVGLRDEPVLSQRDEIDDVEADFTVDHLSEIPDLTLFKK